MNIQGVAAVVTGGASGLGEATARALAQAGAKVAILDMQAGRGKMVAGEIGGVFCEADVTGEASLAGAVAKAREAHGAARILVNCAGIGPARRVLSKKRDTGELVAHDLALFQKVVSINLVGTFNAIVACAPDMARLDPVDDDGQRGVIICTASVAAEDGQIGQAAYSASKGGVVGMTLPIARDLAGYGIRVATIMPGLFHTPMFDSVPEEARKALASAVPFPQRLGKPSEYAALARSIVENDMLNGVTIRLDGSLRMAPK